jgi:hypothetical protein
MPRPLKIISAADPAFLAAALEGLELQKGRLVEQINAVRSMLGRGGARQAGAVAADAAPAPVKRGRNMSAAARRRIAAAQKKRWADYRKKKAAEAKQAG